MRFEYGAPQVAQGRKNQQRQQETPTTFGRSNSAEVFNNVDKLDKPKSRMAGQISERLLEIMENPEEQARLQDWEDRFSNTVDGAQFYSVKMNGGMPLEDGAQA